MGKLNKEIHKSVTKIAKEWGIKPTKLRKKIQEKGIEPDVIYCGCKYYDITKLEKIKPELES